MNSVNRRAQTKLHLIDNDLAAGDVSPWRRVAAYVGLALIFFLLGAVPMWFKARENGKQRDAAQHELRLSHLQNSLSSAVIDAGRGEYEPARQTVSDFFTALGNQLDATGNQALLTPVQSESLRPLLSQRDELITLLARNDPAAAVRLSNFYVAYRKAMNGVRTQSQSSATTGYAHNLRSP